MTVPIEVEDRAFLAQLRADAARGCQFCGGDVEVEVRPRPLSDEADVVLVCARGCAQSAYGAFTGGDGNGC